MLYLKEVWDSIDSLSEEEKNNSLFEISTNYFTKEIYTLNEVTILAKPPISKKEANKWFKNLTKKSGDGIKTGTVKPGYFYHFSEYTAKGFENGTLPFYDKRPMILAIGNEAGHILGINLHYMPSTMRLVFINQLIRKNRKQIREDKPLKTNSWNKVKGISKFTKFMVKLYIKDRIGKIYRIPNNKIKNVVNLDSAEFIGISPNKLFKLVTGKSPKSLSKFNPKLLKPKKIASTAVLRTGKIEKPKLV